MRRSEERFTQDSVWVTATPTEASSAFPFYASEAGRFSALENYSVSRDFHDSFLLLFTTGGAGTVETGGCSFLLPPGCAVLLDCRSFHHYYSSDSRWDFLWIHFQGQGACSFYNLLYEKQPRAIDLQDSESFRQQLVRLMPRIQYTDIVNASGLSSEFHQLFHQLLLSSVRNADKAAHASCQEAELAASYIREHFAEPLTLDMIAGSVHLSKYHFIRLFRRVMGVTPYSYLIHCRINQSKLLLRGTELSVAEIASACGFSDASSYIAQFKKHTGLRPAQYKKEFSGPLIAST
ncbi:AraC family transcriptional regulator [Cuneatibacter caecimuris]|uniref:AraC family transcriptional regulator n=1 Tax=Cuneatibacter caecimuris TaxID=1796618 RepID=A0A4Q7PTA4_9FIRM|nr:AraC family transcriptional regulator [Cuneatibacter caecimuris]RZT02530.1 AraC family transcriptional regulator [Cuneatibacter caecimuris]